MALNVLNQQKLFEGYQTGGQENLQKIVEGEKPMLFDFLLRMTGDASRSVYSIEDTGRKLLSTPKTWESLTEFRFALYNICRKINQDHWNADVGRLENLSLAMIMKNPKVVTQEKRKAAAYNNLDRAIGEIDPLMREIVILHLRSKFTFSEISQIIDKTREEIEHKYGETLEVLRQKVTNLPKDPRSVIARLVPHPLPSDEKTQITDLYELIGGIQKDQRHLLQTSFYYTAMFLVVILLGFVVFLYFNPRMIDSFSSLLKEFLST